MKTEITLIPITNVSEVNIVDARISTTLYVYTGGEEPLRFRGIKRIHQKNLRDLFNKIQQFFMTED